MLPPTHPIRLDSSYLFFAVAGVRFFLFFQYHLFFHGAVLAYRPIPQGTNSLLDPLPARHVGLSSAYRQPPAFAKASAGLRRTTKRATGLLIK
jgi:hypothetical protein